MKILIVEDHHDSATAVAMVLTKLGYHPLVAHDCASARRIAELESPSLAICDLGLPDGEHRSPQNFGSHSSSVMGFAAMGYSDNCSSRPPAPLDCSSA